LPTAVQIPSYSAPELDTFPLLGTTAWTTTDMDTARAWAAECVATILSVIEG
jgi:hypothetical protein